MPATLADVQRWPASCGKVGLANARVYGGGDADRSAGVPTRERGNEDEKAGGNAPAELASVERVIDPLADKACETIVLVRALRPAGHD
jgi:hypothetical protein